jgi:hypothetical protein
MADVVSDAALFAPKLLKFYRVVAQATLLCLNHSKCLCIGLFSGDCGPLREILDACGADGSCIPIVGYADYLGLSIGPCATEETIWGKAKAKLIKRAKEIRGFGVGIGRSFLLYNAQAASVTSYIGRYAAAPKLVLDAEKRAIEILMACPRHAVPSELLWDLKCRGVAVPTPADIEKRCLINCFNLVVKSDAHRLALARIASAEASEHVFALLPCEYIQWKANSFLMKAYRAWLIISGAGCVSLKVLASGNTVSKICYSAVPVLKPRRSAVDIIDARIRYWKFGFDTSVTAARFVACICDLNKKDAQPTLVYALLRGVCNGFNTSRRYSHQALACPFCNRTRGDSLRHLAVCRVVNNAHCLAMPHLRPPMLFDHPLYHLFGLSSDCTGERLLARALLLDGVIAALAAARGASRFDAKHSCSVIVSRITALSRRSASLHNILLALRTGPFEERFDVTASFGNDDDTDSSVGSSEFTPGAQRELVDDDIMLVALLALQKPAVSKRRRMLRIAHSH